MSIKQFLELLGEDPRGRAWQLTLSYCLAESRCSVSDAKELLMTAMRTLDDAVSDGYSRSPDWAWKCLELEMAKTEIAPMRNELRQSTSAYEFSHITTLDVARTWHFPVLTSELAATAAMSPGTDRQTRLQLVQELLEDIQKRGDLKPGAGLMAGLKRLWLGLEVTDTTNPLLAPTLARDERGLIHLGVFDFLLQYMVNPQEVELAVRPTSLDGVGKRFRSWGDATTHEPFGTTVHLEKLANEELKIDGVAECVTPALNLTNSLVQKVSALGHPSVNRGIESTDNDATYAHRLETNLALRGHISNDFLQAIY